MTVTMKAATKKMESPSKANPRKLISVPLMGGSQGN